MFHFSEALTAPLSRSIRARVLVAAFAFIFIFAAVSVNAQDLGSPGQTTAFTYQGHLTEAINSPSGPYDFQFAVFDLAGLQQGPLQTINGVSVANGVFTVSLDFGSAPFALGEDRYLEIRVKKLPATTYTVLSPRQRITSVPYAIRSIRAAAADLATTVPDGAITSSKLASDLTLGGTTTGTFSGNGSGLTGIPAGPAGPQGPQGPAGAVGPMGPQGAQGNIGPQGPMGAMGPIGPQGPQGVQGNNGPQGPAGPIGPNGTNGLNATVRTSAEAAGANCSTGGFKTEFGTDSNGNGTLDNGEVNAALTRYVCNGSQGPAGANGVQGPAGPVGPVGATGANGPQGPTGATGATGAQGPAGPALGNYAFAFHTSNQFISAPSTYSPVVFDTNLQLNGWAHSAGSANFTCTQTGLYLVEYTGNVYMTTGSGSTDYFSLRAVLNGTNEVTGSQSAISPTSPSYPFQQISKSFLVSVTSGQTLSLQMASTQTGNTSLYAFHGPGIPSSASITITRIQ